MLVQRPVVKDRSPGGCHVRAASRADAGRLQEMFSRCSVDTIYERFHAPYSAVPGWMADLMVGVDPGQGEAFVALSGGEIVGHVMYARLDEREAEVAVLVEDAWQSKGLGGRLLREAATRARLRGFETFACETLTTNRRVPGLSAVVFSEVEREVAGATSRIRARLRSLKTRRDVR